jgi:glycerophosphoryl diester phosphodiesterase
MDYVEIDVNTSSDGIMYVFHGPQLHKTTNGTGMIFERTAAELDQLDAGSWFHPRFAGESIPRLEPFLRWISGKAKVFLDVKLAHLDQLVELIYDVGLEDDFFSGLNSTKQPATSESWRLSSCSRSMPTR